MTANPSPAAKLAALHAASFAQGWSEMEFATLLANPATLCAITDHGFALLQVVPPEAELITIAVSPKAREQGNGRAVLNLALKMAKEAGASHVFLEVDAINTAALALYASAGFEQNGSRRAYYRQVDGSRTDAITMAHTIKASIE